MEILSMIALMNVTKSFGKTVAVDDLSLRIEPGEIFGLLGPNGAGKSTSINMTVGLLNPDKGRIAIGDGGSPHDPAVREQLGIAPQALALYDELTAMENLRFFGKIQKMPSGVLKDRVPELLCKIGLWDRRNDRIKTYSGGMKRRLNLAVALIHHPRIVLLDEPTAGVDPQSRHALFESIGELRRDGVTVLLTTHYMEEAEKLSSRVGIMDKGRLLALGRVSDLIASHGGKSRLYAQRADREFFLETDDPMAELVGLQAGGTLLQFKVESPDLEHVFLNLTGRNLRD